ncbi:hypothetical protein PSI23_20250, partial [Xenorhabdus sp. XENO-10]
PCAACVSRYASSCWRKVISGLSCEVVIRIFLFVMEAIRQYGMTGSFYCVAGTVIFDIVQLASCQPCLAAA